VLAELYSIVDGMVAAGAGSGLRHFLPLLDLFFQSFLLFPRLLVAGLSRGSLVFVVFVFEAEPNDKAKRHKYHQ
jgi:hypothetical protein